MQFVHAVDVEAIEEMVGATNPLCSRSASSFEAALHKVWNLLFIN